MNKANSISIAFFGLFLAVLPAFAHHSIAAEFDPGKDFTVTGVLTRVDWINPHIYWYVDVKNDSGGADTWRFQGAPPSMLHRAGLLRSDWKIGETVTVSGKPAKDGSKLGFGTLIKYADGHSIELYH